MFDRAAFMYVQTSLFAYLDTQMRTWKVLCVS